MSDYIPKYEHKFTFGLWTVGNTGRDPFGSPVREVKTSAELVTVNVIEGTAYGDALLAGVGAGVWQDVADACKKVIKVTRITTPNERNAEKYRKNICFIVNCIQH
jgi:hypothetical protein